MLWNVLPDGMEWLLLRHVKEFIAHSGTVLLHGFVGTVPYGNAPHGTLQDRMCRTGDNGRGKKGNNENSGIDSIACRHRCYAE